MARNTQPQRRQHAWLMLTRWTCKGCIAALRRALYNQDFRPCGLTRTSILSAITALETVIRHADIQYNKKP